MNVQGCQSVGGHPEVVRVLAMRESLAGGEWLRFLRQAMEAPLHVACLVHMYFRPLRARALNVLAASGAS